VSVQMVVPMKYLTLSFFFPERLHCCYIDFHCSYLYSNSSRTLWMKCWDSALHTEIS
jgi:hypothetical protein